MCGDLHQFPPVRASEVYKRCRDGGSGLFGRIIKWQYLDYFPLVQVVHQADASFSAMLTKIGDGSPLAEEKVQLLESCFVIAEEALRRTVSAICIFYSNEEVNKFNAFLATQQGGDDEEVIVRLRAKDMYLLCAMQTLYRKRWLD